MSQSSVEVLFRRQKASQEESSVMSVASTHPYLKSGNKGSLPPNIQALHAQLVSRPITVIDRLFYRRKSVLDGIVERTEEPKKVLPQGRLPIWERIHLPQKVPAPNIPNHRIVWSRGKIGQNPQREHSCTEFCLEDPFNRYRLTTGPYEPLHDENTKSYFQAHSVQKLLQDQGLITPRGSVPCTLADFNAWRIHLHAAIYVGKVKRALNQIVEQKEANAAQIKALNAYDRHEIFARENSGRDQKQMLARERAYKAYLATLKKYEERGKKNEQLRRGWEVNMAKEQLERMLRANARDKKRQVELARVSYRNSAARQQLICRILEKEIEAERRLEVKVRDDQRKMEEEFESRIQAHYKVQEIENEREKFVLKALGKEMRENAQWRQLAYTKSQRSVKSLELKKADSRRLELARKYAKKWAELTVKRQLKRCFVPHASLFHIPTELGATVTFLSNHENEYVLPPTSTSAPELPGTSSKLYSNLGAEAVPDRGALEFIFAKASHPTLERGRSKTRSGSASGGTGDAGTFAAKEINDSAGIGTKGRKFSSARSVCSSFDESIPIIGPKAKKKEKKAGGDNIGKDDSTTSINN